jgi:hypothetical protein
MLYRMCLHNTDSLWVGWQNGNAEFLPERAQCYGAVQPPVVPAG